MAKERVIVGVDVGTTKICALIGEVDQDNRLNIVGVGTSQSQGLRKGMVVNKRTQRQTFMKMVQVQGGLGFGVNKNRLIFVFTNEQALRNFVDQGWEFGGQANLSAMSGGQGTMFSGAAAVSPGVYLYQLTETGLSDQGPPQIFPLPGGERGSHTRSRSPAGGLHRAGRSGEDRRHQLDDRPRSAHR